MRTQGKLKLGFYPLPICEARRLRNFLLLPERFSALDPCVGDGIAFTELLAGTEAYRYGIEIDSFRAEQAKSLGITTLQASTMDVRCPSESMSLIYLNPPYDFEAGPANNRRLESVFLEHVYRWLKPGGALLFIIPQPRLKECARLLAQELVNLRVYLLTDPECRKYKQVAVLGLRRRRSQNLSDAEVTQSLRSLETLRQDENLPPLPEKCESCCYPVPPSGPVTLTHTALPLDELEDALLSSSAYRQVRRLLLREQNEVRGRPLTPLHGGHVGLLCTAGMLNGVFGDGSDRHIAHWRSLKFVDHWEEEDEDGTKIFHDRERFSHELTLVYCDGTTKILTHEKKEPI